MGGVCAVGDGFPPATGDAGGGLATPPGIALGMEAGEETAGGMEFAGRRGADGGGGVGEDVAIPMGTN